MLFRRGSITKNCEIGHIRRTNGSLCTIYVRAIKLKITLFQFLRWLLTHTILLEWETLQQFLLPTTYFYQMGKLTSTTAEKLLLRVRQQQRKGGTIPKSYSTKSHTSYQKKTMAQYPLSTLMSSNVIKKSLKPVFSFLQCTQLDNLLEERQPI